MRRSNTIQAVFHSVGSILILIGFFLAIPLLFIFSNRTTIGDVRLIEEAGTSVMSNIKRRIKSL